MRPEEECIGTSPVILHRAGEDYLKAILALQRRNGVVRSLDIAEMLNVSKPSVSAAMKLLREGGFLTMDSNKHIWLTDIGLEIAEQIHEKHRILSECLAAMGVDSKTAEKDACRMEHIVSPETVERMRLFLDTMKRSVRK